MGTFTSERGIWEFDPQTRKWEELETRGDQPEPRSFHTMCAHEVSCEKPPFVAKEAIDSSVDDLSFC